MILVILDLVILHPYSTPLLSVSCSSESSESTPISNDHDHVTPGHADPRFSVLESTQHPHFQSLESSSTCDLTSRTGRSTDTCSHHHRHHITPLRISTSCYPRARSTCYPLLPLLETLLRTVTSLASTRGCSTISAASASAGGNDLFRYTKH